MAARTDPRSAVHDQRITFNVRGDWAVALDAISREEGRTLSEVMREAVQQYLKRKQRRAS